MLALTLACALSAFEPDALLPGSPWALKGHTDSVLAIAFSPDGKLLASASRDRSVRLWDLATGQVKQTLAVPEEKPAALAFSRDGRWLAVGDLAMQVSVIELATGKVARTLAHPSGAGELALSADGGLLIVAGTTDTGAVYDVASGKRRFEFRGRTASLSADGKWLLTARSSGVVALVDLKTGKPVKAVDVTPEQPLATMTGDGKVIATWAPAGVDVKVWSAELKPLGTYKGPVAEMGRPRATVMAVALSPDGQRVLIAGGDGLLRQWDRASNSVAKTWQVEHATAVVVSADGAWLAVADRAVIKLWKP